MSDKQPTTIEDLAKLGGVYGVFFVLQSFGYALGTGQPAVDSVYRSVAFGVSHLSHIFLPWSKVAWPLTPFVAGILLMYAVYLPEQLRTAAGGQRQAQFANRHFFSGMSAVSITAVFGFAASDSGTWFMSLWLAWPVPAFLKSFAYLLLVIFLWWLAYRFVPRIMSVFDHEKWLARPWPELLAAMAVAWLCLLSFLGSMFDGELDLKVGTVLQIGSD